MFLEVESLDEIKKLDKFYMVMILRAIHPNIEHVRDQILYGDDPLCHGKLHSTTSSGFRTWKKTQC